MARDTPLGFPAHTLPYRCGEFTILSTVLMAVCVRRPPFDLPQNTLFRINDSSKSGPLRSLLQHTFENRLFLYRKRLISKENLVKYIDCIFFPNLL